MTGEEKIGLKTDPVCRMTVREEEAVTADCDGVIYYVCSERAGLACRPDCNHCSD